MKSRQKYFLLTIIMTMVLCLPGRQVSAQESSSADTLDRKVRNFLNTHKYSWRDMNVPEVDGNILFDIIVKNGYTNALEIGTSTGHSSIWIAWALSKTGGKLITIEIDEGRYAEALENFKAAGLEDYIDARLADAHELVKQLEGPFDFVFCDADKGWYKQYFIDVYPKLVSGGCFAAHNVSGSSWSRRSGNGQFYQYVIGLANVETTVDNSGNGMSISYKK
jgi:predicted O-methyltransferase YrrM